MKLTSYYTTLLQSTYSGKHTNVKASETQLRTQFKNQLFLQTMNHILIQSSDQSLKLSITNILKQYSRYLINNSQQFLLSKLVDSFINIYKSSPLKPPLSLPLKILLMMSDILKSIFTLDPIHNIRLSVIKNITSQFQTICNNSYDCSQQDCFSLVLLTRSLISSPMFDTLNNDLFKISFDVFVQLNTKLFKQAINQQHPLTLQLIILLRLISELFFYYLKRSDIKTNKIIQSIIWNPKIQNSIISALSYTFKCLKGIYSPSTDNKSIESELMMIQANTFELTEIIMRYRLPEAYKDKFQNQLLSLNTDIIQAIKLVLEVNIDQLCQNQKTLQTITKIIRLYQTLLRYSPHALYFSDNKQIYQTVVFPLLEIPLVLKQSIVDKPDAFINFFNYVFDSSMIDDDKITDPLLSLKTSVAQFVIMSIQFVYILDQTLVFCLEILKNTQQFRDKSVCMIILGILSYDVRNRPDIINSIRQFLELEVSGYVIDASNSIDVHTIQILGMMLISKFLIPISNSSFSSKIFKFVFNILTNSTSQPHRILSLEILTELIKLQGQYKSSTEQLIQYLVNMSNNPHQSVRILDILSELYSNNPTLKQNFELNFKISQYFIRKIKDSYDGKQHLSAIVHSKCWNMINQICQIQIDSKNNSEKFVRQIQKQVSALYNIFQSEQLEDEKQKIIRFNLFLLLRTKQISIYQQQIVLNLSTIIDNSKSGIQLVYQFLMMFIRYGYTWIEQSQIAQNTLFVECAKASYILYEGQIHRQTTAIKGVILLQILLLYSNKINPLVIDIVLQKVIDMVQNCHMYYTFTKSNIVSFLLFCLVNISTLKNESIINKIIEITFNEYDCVKTDFSSKIFVLGLCTLFQDQALSPLVKFDQKHLIIKCASQILLFSLNNVNPQFDDEETEYFENVKLIFSNIPKIDEVEYFKSIILDLKSREEGTFRGIIDKLNDLAKENLASLLRIKFVHSEPRQILKVNRMKIEQ